MLTVTLSRPAASLARKASSSTALSWAEIKEKLRARMRDRERESAGAQQDRHDEQQQSRAHHDTGLQRWWPSDFDAEREQRNMIMIEEISDAQSDPNQRVVRNHDDTSIAPLHTWAPKWESSDRAAYTARSSWRNDKQLGQQGPWQTTTATIDLAAKPSPGVCRSRGGGDEMINEGRDY
jgi:hypothetical protein